MIHFILKEQYFLPINLVDEPLPNTVMATSSSFVSILIGLHLYIVSLVPNVERVCATVYRL